MIAGVALVGVSFGLPEIAQTAAAGVRDLAWAGMGASLLLAGREVPAAKAATPRSEVMMGC